MRITAPLHVEASRSRRALDSFTLTGQFAGPAASALKGPLYVCEAPNLQDVRIIDTFPAVVATDGPSVHVMAIRTSDVIPRQGLLLPRSVWRYKRDVTGDILVDDTHAHRPGIPGTRGALLDPGTTNPPAEYLGLNYVRAIRERPDLPPRVPLTPAVVAWIMNHDPHDAFWPDIQVDFDAGTLRGRWLPDTHTFDAAPDHATVAIPIDRLQRGIRALLDGGVCDDDPIQLQCAGPIEPVLLSGSARWWQYHILMPRSSR